MQFNMNARGKSKATKTAALSTYGLGLQANEAITYEQVTKRDATDSFSAARFVGVSTSNCPRATLASGFVFGFNKIDFFMATDSNTGNQNKFEMCG